MLNIYAGNNALKTIEREGFKPDLFSYFLGASGGHKWFVLSGLDKYIFGDFFAGRTAPLNVIGSSIGSFRAACFCQDKPVEAINRFIDAYLSVTYEGRPTPEQVTESSVPIIKAILGDDDEGIAQIVNNEVFKAHFIVSKSHGLVAKENKYLQILGLLKSVTLNAVKRSLIKSQYRRYIFQQSASELAITDPDGFIAKSVSLSSDNLRDSLLASGCIPLVMAGVKDIKGAGKGMYRDGGIIDYHFDIKIDDPGLTLYPHFSSTIKPGWFDKGLKRSFSAKNYANTVVICPSDEFIQSLPFQKISDRKDFEKMSDKDRVVYWKTIISRSKELADDFADFTKKQDFSRIKLVESLQ
jgi:hypothetical protein